MHKDHQIIIIGSGPAGLSAAVFAARAQFNPLVITGSAIGGQLLRTNSVRNWPGIELIEGPQLMRDLETHARNAGAHLLPDIITHASLATSHKIITVSSGAQFAADAVIIACGTAPRRLNCLGETTYWNNGVFTSLPENLASYAGKQVHIIGGGNSAIHFASRLLPHVSTITIVQAAATLTATDTATTSIINDARVTIQYEHTVRELSGTASQLLTITLAHQTGAVTTAHTDGVFLALGGAPNTALFKNDLALTPSGHIVVEPGTTLTSIPGVFAAGDVADSRYRHAITSAGQGCMAALDAERYINGKVVIRF
jgi:thioredoxin reductase (NADPH)